MALNKGTWDPKPRDTNSKGTHLNSLNAVMEHVPHNIRVKTRGTAVGANLKTARELVIATMVPEQGVMAGAA